MPKKEIPFSVRLRSARSEIATVTGLPKKLNQAEMGKLLGVHPNYIARLERGESEPSATIERCLTYAVNLAILTRINPLVLTLP